MIVSQLDNLIELIRTVNEVYFITAPERVRAAYILVDDIVELSLKTFLYQHTLSQREQCLADFRAAGLLTSNTKQKCLESYFDEKTTLADLASRLGQREQFVRQRLSTYHHTPVQHTNCKAAFSSAGLLSTLAKEQALDDYFSGVIDRAQLTSALGQQEDNLQVKLQSFGDLRHWSANALEQHVSFYRVVTDVQALFPAQSAESEMLQAAFERHEGRNRLYHDHHHTAWSVSDIRCLRAMCDLFNLLEVLFPDFSDTLTGSQYKTVRCQIGVLRLKLKSEEGQNELVQPYKNALQTLQREHVYDLHERSVEHSIVHTVSDSFFRALRDEYKTAVAELEVRVRKLQEMMQDPRRKRSTHPGEYIQKSQRLELFREELSEIEALLGSP